jgi:hypothetical protein
MASIVSRRCGGCGGFVEVSGPLASQWERHKRTCPARKAYNAQWKHLGNSTYLSADGRYRIRGEGGFFKDWTLEELGGEGGGWSLIGRHRRLVDAKGEVEERREDNRS